MDVLVSHHVTHIHILLLSLHHSLFIRLRIIQRQRKSSSSDSFIKSKLLTMHQLPMRLRTSNIIDQLRYGCIEMCILILILISYIFRWMVDIPNIGSSKSQLLFYELRQHLPQQLLLVLVSSDHVLEILDLQLMQLLFFDFFFFSSCMFLSACLEDIQTIFFDGLLVAELLELFLIVGVCFQPSGQVLDGGCGFLDVEISEATGYYFTNAVLLEVVHQLAIHIFETYIIILIR